MPLAFNVYLVSIVVLRGWQCHLVLAQLLITQQVAKIESCTPCPPGTFSAVAGASSCVPCASQLSAPEGSSSCRALEHAKIILKLTGSIDTFGEGSVRRKSVSSGLAATLGINEKQIVIISLTAGSVIIELVFMRVEGAQVSPTEAVLLLKTVASSGQLEKFGLTGLTVGQENVFEMPSESANVGVTVGA
jgi:hypothetical protein